MKLDELKKMIAEEFESYMKEDEVDVSVGADDVDMDADMDMEPGMGEEQSPEDALEKIYQMLQAYFEDHRPPPPLLIDSLRLLELLH